MSDIKWWAYLHTNGSVQLKRFFDTRDIDEAYESPFVDRVTLPFSADSREQAMETARSRFGLSP